MMLIRVVVLVVLLAAVLGDLLYVVRVGMPNRYPDHAIGWFMASIGFASIGSHVVLALLAGGVLRAESAGVAFVAASLIELAAIWFRVWMSWHATPKLRESAQSREASYESQD